MLNSRQDIPSKQNLEARLPLWLLLVSPFLLIMLFTILLTSYLSQKNSRALVDTMAEQLMNETNARIHSHLQSFLSLPQAINETNAQLLQSSILELRDIEGISRHLWQEAHIYESVSSVYIGNPQGGIISSGREAESGEYYVLRTAHFAAGELSKYSTDENGNLADLLFVIPSFDARIRPWYMGAVEAGVNYWASPYVLSTGQDLAIASSLPVYDENGDLIAVVSVDLFLSQIRDFLASLRIGKTGKSYIIEHSGLLVSSSNPEQILYEQDHTGNWLRINSLDSTDTVLVAVTESLSNEETSLKQEENTLQTLEIDGEAYYVMSSPFREIEGLDWQLVTIIPHSDFLAGIEAQNQTTLLLTLAATLLAIVVAIFAAFRISRPISNLSRIAGKLARGDWQESVPIEGVRDVRILAAAFNEMTNRLQESFQTLEERVEERTLELSQSQARYRAIVEDQTDLVSRFNPDYTVSFANDAYCRFFGQSLDSILGKSFMPSLDREVQEQVAASIEALSLENPSAKVEHRMIRADGQVRWMQWINRRLYDEAGNFVELQAVGRDISDAKAHEQALEKALAKEAELNKLKSQFISTVSHEFRTPLAIIMNSNELIQAYAKRNQPEKQEQHFERIKYQVKVMTELLNDVLAVSQGTVGKPKAKQEAINLEHFLRDIIAEIDAALPQKTLLFDFRFLAENPEIMIDRKALRLLAMNLISNAAKYSHEGGKVLVQLERKENTIHLQVQDWGIGIPEEAQVHLFEPFYRASNINAISGTGLGLTIVKQAVDELKGTILIESEENQGTSIYVSLPINSEDLPNGENSSD